MHQALWRRNRKRGNVTTMWIAGLPVFMIFFMFLSSLVIAWMQHAVAEKAADAGSLAATKKMDELVNKEIQLEMVNILQQNTGGTLLDPYMVLMGSPEARRQYIRNVVFHHQDEIKAEVAKYVRKNGAEPSKVLFFSDGRIQVEAKMKFQPMILKDQFANTYVKGIGFGPTRDYGKWWPNKLSPLTINFN